MSRLNFREACLLDASGELGNVARRAFLEYIRENPQAADEYREICAALQALEDVPPTEFSAQQRVEIPASIKLAIRHALLQQEREKQAAKRQKLIHYAWASVGSLAAALAVLLGLGLSARFAHLRREQEQVAKISSAIDRLVSYSEQPANPYEQAVKDVEASIRQLQTESPTLAQVQDHNMGNLLNALVLVPEDWDDVAFTDVPPSPSPGSM